MLGFTEDKLVTHHAFLWHDPNYEEAEPVEQLSIDEDFFIRRINALLPPHGKQRLQIHDRNFSPTLDAALRKMFGMEEAK